MILGVMERGLAVSLCKRHIKYQKGERRAVGVFRFSNLTKTIYYLRRNGIANTCYTIRERLSASKEPPYVYQEPSKETLERQRGASLDGHAQGFYEGIRFSIVVPTYRTVPRYLIELIESVKAQSYPDWELILADATEDDSVRVIVEGRRDDMVSFHVGDEQESLGAYRPGGILYVKLSRNEGIAANTNEALKYVRGDYVGLLDHDDILTPDALFEMAETIRGARGRGIGLQLVYSDEDKCNGDVTEFYEPNCKEKFNYDLILSNNYICHFMMLDNQLIQKLQLRSEYDGAQDYDLILRAVTELGIPGNPSNERLIWHVPKVLYHWRCHTASTAENPHSKDYAYQAGQRALQDHLTQNHVNGKALPLKHLGFYQVHYDGDEIFAERSDLGAVGGVVLRRGKIAGGRMDETGRVFYDGLPARYSGYLHRAALAQDAEAVDIRCIALREELWSMFQEITGVTYRRQEGSRLFDASTLPEGSDYKELSLKLCRAIRERGYRILWCRREEFAAREGE